MFKNMKIGMKVASGIGIMVAIIIVVMSFVSYTLIQIKGNMITLSDEYMKQVEISNNIERTTHNIMYNIRGYGLSQNPIYLEAGLALFAENEANLNQAITLASGSTKLQDAAASFNQSKTALLEYKDLVNSTKTVVDSYVEAQNNMATAAEDYFNNTDSFLVTQYDSLNSEIAQGASAAALQERTQKIKLINDIKALGAETRVNALKAMETKELTYIDSAMASLSKAEAEIADIRKITYKQNNLDQLDQMLKAAATYGQGVETVKASLTSLNTLASEREAKGNTLIDNSMAMASEGLATTQALAAEINSEVQQSIFTMIIGIVISLLIGIVINYFVIVSITKSIKKMTVAADKLAVGDVNVEITADSKDEIGQLAKSFNNMVEGIKAQSEVVRKIADGENGITVEIRSDEDILNLKLQEAVENLGVLQAQTEELTAAVEQGNLVKRGDINVLNGIWSDLIKGINNLIDAFVRPINVTNDYITKLGNGDIPPVITDTYYGDFNNIKNSLNNCINSIDNLVEDTNQLIDSALKGKLDTRADETKHNGKYKEIVAGVNQTLDAVIEPVKEASDVLTKMSKGNLNSFVEGEYKGDHAVIKNALNNTITSIRGYISEISEVLNKMSQGDLRTEIKSEFMGDFVGLKESLNHILYRFNEVLGEINVASDQVASASKQVSQSSQALSQGSTEQASSVEEITASITEITEQTRQNADSAENANNLSQKAMDDAVKGNEQMQEMISAMKDINESSANISKIISVIDEIAFQTNILALNAAVEAARAGQYGKGFAVVAEEVRNLAARSANAAKETTVLIENSIQKVNTGTEIANGTAAALAKIVEGVKGSSKIVGDISVASKEQADSLVQINEGINQISMVTQSNTATAEESAAASEEMTSQATVLKEMVDRFKLKDVSHGRSSFAQSYVQSPKSHDHDHDYDYDEDIQINLDDVEFGKY